jgi:hypothetical protein
MMEDNDELSEYQTQLGEVEGLLQATPDDPSLLSLKADLLELINATIVVVANNNNNNNNNKIAPPAAVEEEKTTFTDMKNHESSSSSSSRPSAETTTGIVSDWSTVLATATGASGGNNTSDDTDQQQQLQQQDALLHTANLHDRSTTINSLLETAADRLDPESSAKSTAVARNDGALPADITLTAVAVAKKAKPSKRKHDDDHDFATEDSVSSFQVPRHLVIDPDADSQAEQNRKRRAIKVLKNKWRIQKKEAEARSKQKSWQSFQKKVQSSKKQK